MPVPWASYSAPRPIFSACGWRSSGRRGVPTCPRSTDKEEWCGWVSEWKSCWSLPSCVTRLVLRRRPLSALCSSLSVHLQQTYFRRSLLQRTSSRRPDKIGLSALYGSNGTSMSHDHMWRRRPRFEAARYLNSSSVRVLAARHRLQHGRVPARGQENKLRPRSKRTQATLFDEHALLCRLISCYGGSSTRQNPRQPCNG